MFLRTIAAGTALALLVQATPARADDHVPETWSNNFWGRTTYAGPGEVPLAKKIVTLTMLGAAAVSLGAVAYFAIDAQVQYSHEKDVLAAHGSNMCVNLNDPTCSDLLSSQRRRYDDGTYMVSATGAMIGLLVGSCALGWFWPNAPVTAGISPSAGVRGGSMQLQGSF